MLSDVARSAGPYTTDGVQVEFSFDFKMFSSDISHIVVTSTEDGVITELTYTTDFTVTLNADQDDDPGGIVTMLVAPDGPTLTITSDIPYEQQTEITNQSGYWPAVLNRALDRVVMLVQQLSEQAERAPYAPLDSTDYAGMYPVVDADGNWLFSAGTGNDADLRTDLAATTGGTLVATTNAGTGAATRSVRSALRDFITDAGYDTLQHAATAAAGKELLIVTDRSISTAITLSDGTTVRGAGGSVTVSVAEVNAFVMGNDCSILDLEIAGPNASTTVTDFAKGSGVYASGKTKIGVSGCRIWGFNNCGVQVRDCNDVQIEGNWLYKNFWVHNTSADILLYSGTAGRRCIIRGNFCLSNNSQGICVNATGKDADVLVTGNTCVTLATDGTEYTMPTSSASVRRHGIIATYESTATTGRIIVTNNICRNTLWTGIYVQSSALAAGLLLISGNFCSKNGYETGNSLSGGIWADTQCPVNITSNTVLDYQGDTVGAITISVAANNANHSKVSGNHIVSSLSHGIYITGRTRHCDITDNTIMLPAGNGINVGLLVGIVAAGGINIHGNTIVRGAGNAAGISFTQADGLLRSRITNNKIKGYDATTAASWNSGIYMAALTDAQYCTIKRNEIDTFCFGIYYAFYWTAATRFVAEYADYNHFSNCALGIMANANAVTTTLVAFEGNTYDSTVTNRFGGFLGLNAGYDVRRCGTKLEVYGFTAVPTVGQFAVGDRTLNQAGTVGQPKAWTCTVAGSAGTQTSEGNL